MLFLTSQVTSLCAPVSRKSWAVWAQSFCRWRALLQGKRFHCVGKSGPNRTRMQRIPRSSQRSPCQALQISQASYLGLVACGPVLGRVTIRFFANDAAAILAALQGWAQPSSQHNFICGPARDALGVSGGIQTGSRMANW